MAELIPLIWFQRCMVVCTSADEVFHFGAPLKPWLQSFHYENAPVLPLWKWHLILQILIHFFVHPCMKMDTAWQTRSVSGTQKAPVRRKMVPISFFWYFESLLGERDFFFVFCLLVRQSRLLSCTRMVFGNHYEGPGLSCVKCYLRECLWFGGWSLQVVHFYYSLLLLSKGAVTEVSWLGMGKHLKWKNSEWYIADDVLQWIFCCAQTHTLTYECGHLYEEQSFSKSSQGTKSCFHKGLWIMNINRDMKRALRYHGDGYRIMVHT